MVFTQATMKNTMLKIAFAFFACFALSNPAIAQGLRGGDLIVVKGHSQYSLQKLNTDSGEITVISGCTDPSGDDNCQSVKGEGPWPIGFQEAVVSPAGKIFAWGYVAQCSPSQAQVTGGCVASGYRIVEIDPVTGNRSSVDSGVPQGYALAMVPSFFESASVSSLSGWAIPLLVGFLIGMAYMKGRSHGKAAA